MRPDDNNDEDQEETKPEDPAEYIEPDLDDPEYRGFRPAYR